MDALLIAVVGVIVIVLATVLAPKVGIAGPLVLVGIGLAVSLLPFVPAFSVDPEIILVGILPPLLYSAAVSLPAIEFRRDFGPISGMAVILVLVSAVALGFFFNAMIPGLGLPLAIGLGALLSPTDAVATSIIKRLGISPRVVTMLDGESLLNDATSLVLLRTAIAAAAGSFSLLGAVGTFAWSVVIAVAVGALVGWINLRVRRRITHAAAATALSFTVPFVAYLPTEHLGGSGLVAAVVAGIVTGQGARRWFTPEQRRTENANWHTVELLLEGAVFLIMGLEVKELLRAAANEDGGIWQPIWLALVALAIILAVRALYITIVVWVQNLRLRGQKRERLQRISDRVEEIAADPGSVTLVGYRGLPDDPERQQHRVDSMRTRVGRAIADLDYYQASPLGWRHGTIIVWAGMRGVVTLAAAQTLPEDAHLRPVLILIAFFVALASLLLQGLTVPLLVRALFPAGSDDDAPPPGGEARALNSALTDAAAEALAAGGLTRADGSAFPEETLRVVGSRLTAPPDDEDSHLHRDRLELRLALLKAMRERLNELSHGGTYSTAALRHSLAELDAEQISLELRLQPD